MGRMWGLVLVVVAVLLWLGWWVRRPHHRHRGGARSRDGHFASRYLTVDDGNDDPPGDQVLPGEYEGD